LATVITNLLSAIPLFGPDLVELTNILPTIGKISVHALKKGRLKKSEIDKKEYINIPNSFLSMLLGLIDGEGFITIHKTTKGYIKINLIIEFNIRDLSILQYIHSILNLGKITILSKSQTCRFIINRTEIQEVFFPLILHNKLFFLTNIRREQFNKAIYILENDIKMYAEIPSVIPDLFPLPETALNYTNLPFFKNWIVGFTIAEGSFLIKSNKDACFQLRQRIHNTLFESFKLNFKTNRKIGLDNKLYNLFSVSSKADIQRVIDFFSFSGNHPLLGHQNIRYEKWLIYLKNSKRYNSLKFP
jgi:LAGLIDADG endonuclease